MSKIDPDYIVNIVISNGDTFMPLFTIEADIFCYYD